MPSVRSLLTGIALTTFTLLQSTSATPLPKAGCLKSVTLPVTGGPTDLPASTLTLSNIAVGRGIQNYTCEAAGSVPKAIGAIATLFDASELASRDINLLHKIPPKAVYLPLPANAKSLTGPLAPAGKHYFDAAGTPTFDFSTSKTTKILFVAKSNNVPAPATANKGPAGTGAVDWLKLDSKAGYTSVGLKQVYRVVTAGGVAPACTAPGVISVQYAAEYWFYN